jgi:hypothetical protein
MMWLEWLALGMAAAAVLVGWDLVFCRARCRRFTD